MVTDDNGDSARAEREHLVEVGLFNEQEAWVAGEFLKREGIRFQVEVVPGEPSVSAPFMLLPFGCVALPYYLLLKLALGQRFSRVRHDSISIKVDVNDEDRALNALARLLPPS